MLRKYVVDLSSIYSLAPVSSPCSIWLSISSHYDIPANDSELMLMIGFSPDVGSDVVYGGNVVDKSNADAVVEVLSLIMRKNMRIDTAVEHVSKVSGVNLEAVAELLSKATFVVNLRDGYEQCWAVYKHARK